MTHGRHVTCAKCQEMRRLREETSYTLRVIDQEVVENEEPYSHDTVEWHVNGRYAHPDGT